MVKYSNINFGQTEAALNILGGEQALVTILSDSNLASQVARCIKDLIENAAAYLAPLYEGDEILLAATMGSATIAGAGDLFSAFLSEAFAVSDMNRPSKNTRATKVRVLEQRRNGAFMQLFTSVDVNLDRLCFTQSQIIQFCCDHRDKLRQDGYATFFLFKVGKKYFVACVSVDGSGLYAYVCRLDDPRVWYAEHRYRVVVPQLTV